MTVSLPSFSAPARPQLMACWRRLPLRALAWVAAAALAGPAGAQPSPPAPFPPGDLQSVYPGGISVADPYRALEALEAPATQAWAQAQNAYTHALLEALPGLPALRQRLAALDSQRTPSVAALEISRAGRWFYLKRDPGARTTKLFVRDREDAPERLLANPDLWERASGQPHAINNFSVSPDGRHVALVVSKGDAELGELQVLSSDKARPEMPPLPGVWGELSASWAPDSRSLVMLRGEDAVKPGGQPFGRMQMLELRLPTGWRAGRPSPPPRVLASWSASPAPGGLGIREPDWVFLDRSGSPGRTVALLAEGVSADQRAGFVSHQALARDGARARWTPLFGTEAGVRGTAVFGPYVYARSYQGAPRYRVMRYDLRAPQQPPVEVVTQQEGVIDDLSAAQDGLFYVVRTGSVSRLWRLPHGAAAGQAQEVALPFVGAVALLQSSAEQPGVVFSLEGWTQARRLYRSAGLGARLTALIPEDRSGVGQDWVSEEARCTSHDGVQVPMSLIHKRGLPRDGQRPVVLDGYGGYGVSEPAYFNRRLDPWLQMGGIWVDVKPRGGGAYGREWYQAGVGPRKANTWKDMIACAQALVDKGYTQPARLAIMGTSMGGVAVGRAITERPDLFAAAIVRVGITDTVRFIEATSNGPNHKTEMGDVESEQGLRQLLAMSTYANITPGTAYPAVLFTTGLNDKRVAPWQSFKTQARMAAATRSGRPVLLRVEAAGGHGMAQTTEQRNAELADVTAFTAWRLGLPDFQPLAPAAATAPAPAAPAASATPASSAP